MHQLDHSRKVRLPRIMSFQAAIIESELLHKTEKGSMKSNLLHFAAEHTLS